MPTAYRAEFSNVSCDDGCGGLRCAVGGGCSLRGGPCCRFAMQVVVRFVHTLGFGSGRTGGGLGRIGDVCGGVA